MLFGGHRKSPEEVAAEALMVLTGSIVVPFPASAVGAGIASRLASTVRQTSNSAAPR